MNQKTGKKERTTMRKVTRMVVAFALVLMMGVMYAAPAFAAQTPNNNTDGFAGGVGAVTSDTPGVSVQAAIAKVLQTPIGTVIPDMNFNFVVTAQSVDGYTGDVTSDYPANNYSYTAATDTSNMPVIGDSPDMANGTGTITVAYPGDFTKTTAGNTDTYTLETPDIFSGVTFPHAGIYVYTVTEQSGTYTITDPSNESLTYSPAVYHLIVYVENGPTGPYIAAVGDVVGTANDPSTVDNGSQTPGYKIDPTPGGNGTSTDTGYSDMTFTNTYVHTNGTPDNPNPLTPDDQNLVVSKTVPATGYADLTKYFDYTMTVVAPDLTSNSNLTDAQQTSASPDSNKGPYTAYIINTATNTVVSANDLTSLNKVSALPVSTDTNGGYFTVTSDETFSFCLQNGQELVFTDTPVGTTYVANEDAYDNYTAGVVVTYAGLTPPASTVNPNAGLALSTDSAVPANNPYMATGATVPSMAKNLVGEGVNSAAFTNTYLTIAPTGILLNNLPYIGLIAFVVALLGAFIVVKSRKKSNQLS